jgi:hypothetical protein
MNAFTAEHEQNAASEPLIGALLSDEPLPRSIRRVFALMIAGEWPGAPGVSVEWTLGLKRRRDLAATTAGAERMNIAVEVSYRRASGQSASSAYEEVGELYGRDPRTVEGALARHRDWSGSFTPELLAKIVEHFVDRFPRGIAPGSPEARAWYEKTRDEFVRGLGGFRV